MVALPPRCKSPGVSFLVELQYSISFWDVGYSYEVGQTTAGDWIGVRTQSEFEYNP
ncbi:MAG: hypothetical protein PUP90_21140 [Nostoc sp. S4]|nr:hypothetical protein [Nostoc sp. S4]